MAGYDTKNKVVLHRKYICTICSLILKDPIQLTCCGLRICESCFQHQHGMKRKCLQCLTETLPSLIHRYDILNHYLSEKHQNILIKVLYQMQVQMENKRKSSTETNSDLSRSMSVVAVDFNTALFQELCEILDISTDELNAMASDRQEQFNNALFQCQMKYPTLTLKFLQLKVSIQEIDESLNGPTVNNDNVQMDLTNLNETIGNSQYMPYDGTLIWKITNVQQKIIDAQSERQTSIYSPLFYSSPVGYKMCVRLYLNGDGNARRTHMSLFFVLIRSPNDAILQYPFNYKVTFCLYDQTPAQRHIINSFQPDIRSSSFQRPRSDMNIASGIPKFFPLEMIQPEGNPYVRDGTMFIKIMIDFGNIPNPLLPYAFNLNPGLPTHIQQVMINREVERRSQQHH
ncbi:unnamed protein product [Rotaria sp. Silwood2]|nr:unnamed protein product [Rotaria sp. Silwood2]CAF3077290.1 unnamed protein product [Rotaria sp. Silwood2]CAF3269675.1 unnamed protein product [Rotaria sp. Silwood2]CAF3420955.1 unnamed protein product [Rotaria sp. Silwood2]CAF4220816.1 unnamed protein product [Rotaria sp. Silwood2]